MKLDTNGRSIMHMLKMAIDGPDFNLDFSPYDTLTKEDPGLDIDEETIRMLIEDERKPFGHGYTIAALLLDGQNWMS